jgi:hypothetical protein
MNVPKALPILISLFICNVLQAQLRGIITNTEGEPLPYATVYIQGTSSGTVSNGEGQYELELKEPGNYTVTFQYVGYQKFSYTFSYDGQPLSYPVILKHDTSLVREIVISANREDPAFEIIRKAIKKRKYYKQQVASYEADLYVKGVIKMLDAPKEIMGEKIGNLGGLIDTTGKGILYLSESKSAFYFQAPNQTKEVMEYSVKSADNSLFTANQFSWASFDLYTEYINFGRSIVSPIADNALIYYNYTLEQSFVDPQGYIVNKIKILPKSTNSPLLTGYIYITDDLWNVYSTDLLLAGPAIKNTFLDTIQVKQVYVPVKNPDVWRLFTYVFSNYDLEKDVSPFFKTNETFKVEQNALKRDSAFWNEIRPIPLTEEEKVDYIQKDSLRRIWETPAYRDSVDRENNQFSALKLLTGYSIVNSRKNTSLTFPSPLGTIRFNAMEGFKLGLNAIYEKEDSTYRKWTVNPILDYGFSDKTWKPKIRLEYRFDNYSLGKIFFSAGRTNQQFEPREPITERNNTWSSLWDKENKIRLYRNDFASIGYSQEILNGLFLDISSTYTHRSPIFVTTQYSFRKPLSIYDENIPRTDLPEEAYAENTYWRNSVEILIRPGHKFSSYPNLKIRDVSEWPNITLAAESGISLSENTANFSKLTLRLRDYYVNMRLAGYFSYNAEAGWSLGTKPKYFGDYFHPMGNELLSPIAPDLSSFNLLPYYEYSTNNYYMQLNFRHHFNGFIADRIPLINKTSFKFVSGFSGLYEPSKGRYLELFAGIENFRLGPVQLFDIDYTWSFDENGFRDHGITIRLSRIFAN